MFNLHHGPNKNILLLTFKIVRFYSNLNFDILMILRARECGGEEEEMVPEAYRVVRTPETKFLAYQKLK